MQEARHDVTHAAAAYSRRQAFGSRNSLVSCRAFCRRFHSVRLRFYEYGTCRVLFGERTGLDLNTNMRWVALGIFVALASPCFSSDLVKKLEKRIVSHRGRLDLAAMEIEKTVPYPRREFGSDPSRREEWFRRYFQLTTPANLKISAQTLEQLSQITASEDDPKGVLVAYRELSAWLVRKGKTLPDVHSFPWSAVQFSAEPLDTVSVYMGLTDWVDGDPLLSQNADFRAIAKRLSNPYEMGGEFLDVKMRWKSFVSEWEGLKQFEDDSTRWMEEKDKIVSKVFVGKLLQDPFFLLASQSNSRREPAGPLVDPKRACALYRKFLKHRAQGADPKKIIASEVARLSDRHFREPHEEIIRDRMEWVLSLKPGSPLEAWADFYCAFGYATDPLGLALEPFYSVGITEQFLEAAQKEKKTVEELLDRHATTLLAHMKTSPKSDYWTTLAAADDTINPWFHTSTKFTSPTYTSKPPKWFPQHASESEETTSKEVKETHIPWGYIGGGAVLGGVLGGAYWKWRSGKAAGPCLRDFSDVRSPHSGPADPFEDAFWRDVNVPPPTAPDTKE